MDFGLPMVHSGVLWVIVCYFKIMIKLADSYGSCMPSLYPPSSSQGGVGQAHVHSDI